jgi:hypothetical protein
MKNLLKVGIIAFAFSLLFISVDSVNAQGKGNQKEAKREYKQEMREARREFRQDRREARRDYRQTTGRRLNRGYYVSRSNRGYAISSSRRAYPQRTRVYYRNGRRYVRSY